mmetsp:Transcript_44443/g.105303  ORF Transcript_44443/g.105303 Transcript_44443/m.105303 type:complete len:662 (+) Transcript_44443:97-2082(+)
MLPRWLRTWVLLLRAVAAQIHVLRPPELANYPFNGYTKGQLHGATAAFAAPHFEQKVLGVVLFAPSDSLHCKPDYGASDVTMGGTAEEASSAAGQADSSQRRLASIAPSQPAQASNSSGSMMLKAREAAVWKSILTEDYQLARIIMVQRGQCSLESKVMVAQEMGAEAVIIIDSPGSVWTEQSLKSQVWIGGESRGSVRIPAVLVTRAQGEHLALEARRKILGYNLQSKEHSVADLVWVKLEWDVPDQEVVSFHMWMNSADAKTQTFLQGFADTARGLGSQLTFEPHFRVQRLEEVDSDYHQCIGPAAKCIEGADESDVCDGDATCLSSCTSQILPRPPLQRISNLTEYFCCTDPDGPGVVEGSDVVQQDLLQLCIHDVHQKEGAPTLQFWEFVRKLPTACPLEASFTSACGHELMRDLADMDVDAVTACELEDGVEKLRVERGNQGWGPPAVMINGWRYSGPLDVQEVTRALCLGYRKDRQPSTCQEFTKNNPTDKPHGTQFSYEELQNFVKEAERQQKEHQRSIDQTLQEILAQVSQSPVQGPSTTLSPPLTFMPSSPGGWSLPVITTSLPAGHWNPNAGLQAQKEATVDRFFLISIGFFILAALFASVGCGMMMQARLMRTAVADLRLSPPQRAPLLAEMRSTGNGTAECVDESGSAA